MAVTRSYRCECLHPSPMIYNGEDWGLCIVCRFVYDENLYERRLRQHVPGYQYEDVSEYLAEASAHYRAMAALDEEAQAS